MNNAYTLISMKTGKYISHLFEDEHNKTFATNKLTEAYSWSNLESVTRIKNEIGQCIIIKLS